MNPIRVGPSEENLLLPANRVRELSRSLIRELANAAMGRADVLPFWFGESDQPTPPFIREAAEASLRRGETFYTENLGRMYLREAISRYLTDLHQCRIETERVAVTSSGDLALMLTSQLLVDPGDKVVTITPLWPNAVEIPKIMGAKVTCVTLEPHNGRWTLPLEKLLTALSPNTRMLVLNSPNNPTGWTISRDEQLVILDHCRRHGIWILADDVYERLAYREGLRSAPSFLALTNEQDRLVVVNSFSKAWSMTGWRVGWMVLPPSLVPDLLPLLEYNASCVAEFVQRAATAAVAEGEPWVLKTRAELGRTKQELTSRLREFGGLEVPEADGAMYLFFRFEGRGDSFLLAKELIEKVGLGLAPGRAFGPEGEGWLRWCYAAEWSKIESGIDRLRRFLSR